MAFKSETPAEVQERLRQDTIRQREATLGMSEGQAHQAAEERDAEIAEAVEASTAPLDEMELQRRELASRGALGALDTMPSRLEGVSIQGVDGESSGEEPRAAQRRQTRGAGRKKAE